LALKEGGLIRQGVITANIGQTYALEDATQAQRDLESGKTIGATILRP
jgi:NADPH2:quinone reductase